MLVTCTASLDNKLRVENLCQCINILGGKPCVDGYEVKVTYDGNDATAEKFIELFSHYPTHGIFIIE